MLEWAISAAALTAIIIALRLALRGKISLRLQYALWLPVLLRLIVPFCLGTAEFSIGNLTQLAAKTETGRFISALSDTELPRRTYSAAYDEAEREYAEKGADISGMPDAEFSETVDYEIMSRMGGTHSIRDVIVTVWIIGAAAVGLALIFSNIRFAAGLKKSRRIFDGQTYTLPVYVSPMTDTPCLHGLFRPAVYLTPEAAEDETVRRHSIRHELTHFSHGDHVWSALRGVCLAVHWYNPLVWWAAILSRNDSELACDEATVKMLGENERAEYGRTLIEMTCRKRPDILLTATTMTGGKGSLRERIAMLAKKPKTAAAALVAVILIVAAAAGCTFTGAGKDIAEEPKTPSVKTEADGSVPAAAADFAADYMGRMINYYNDVWPEINASCRITGGTVTGLTQINTGTAGLERGINMYLLEYRLSAEGDISSVLVGGMTAEDGCITEWGSTGQPYLLLSCDGDGNWERIGVTSTDSIDFDYGTPEMLEMYGDKYTAAAMEIYEAYQAGKADNSEEPCLVGFAVQAEGSYKEIGLKWAEEYLSQYLSLPEGNPRKSAECAVMMCELSAESLLSSPRKTLVFNMRFACNAADDGKFMESFAGWAERLTGQKQYDGWIEFGWFVELSETEDGLWTCTDAGTGGFGGWGYLNFADVNDVGFFLERLAEGDLDMPENLLRALPFIDWKTLDATDYWNALYELLDKYCITEGQVYGPEETRMWSDVYPEDQAYRNMYVMLAALNSDGAYSEGLSSILQKQRDYDAGLFEKCIENLPQRDRDRVRGLADYG